MDADQITPRYELKDELARFCLPSAKRDASLKLAWMNSVCILFLLIGIAGARRGVIAIKPVPPIRVEVPIVIQPTVLPPQAIAQKPEQAEQINQPRVLVALPNAPDVNFGIPTVGTLVVPAALAAAPRPQAAPVRIGSLNNTGAGGDRPEPRVDRLGIRQRPAGGRTADRYARCAARRRALRSGWRLRLHRGRAREGAAAERQARSDHADLGGGVEAAERHANGTARTESIEAQCRQHIRRFGAMRRTTGATGRYGDSGFFRGLRRRLSNDRLV